jgi:hypothetical protein
MAFIAGNIYMLAIKDKPGCIVVKFTGFPVVESVAPVTICNPFQFKLPVMNILVAGSAIS